MMKKGFTIVELLMVIGIIAVLMGIVTTAASESMKASRSRRADALCTLVQSGLAVYYAQNDEWPVSLRNKGGSNQEGNANYSDENVYVLSASEVRRRGQEGQSHHRCLWALGFALTWRASRQQRRPRSRRA